MIIHKKKYNPYLQANRRNPTGKALIKPLPANPSLPTYTKL